MKSSPLVDFFEDLDFGYYRLTRPDNAVCVVQWYKGNLSIHQIFGDDTTLSTLAIIIPILDAFPFDMVLALAHMIQVPWVPITKSEFVETLDQYLPD